MPIIDGDPVESSKWVNDELPTGFHFSVEKHYVLTGELLVEYHQWRDDFDDTVAMRLWFLRDKFITPEIFNTHQGLMDPDAHFNVLGHHRSWLMAETLEQGLVKNWRAVADERA
jgi:hypothetical protein